eukprot:7389075-Prymnesium_polylepis.1
MARMTSDGTCDAHDEQWHTRRDDGARNERCACDEQFVRMRHSMLAAEKLWHTTHTLGWWQR